MRVEFTIVVRSLIRAELLAPYSSIIASLCQTRLAFLSLVCELVSGMEAGVTGHVKTAEPSGEQIPLCGARVPPVLSLLFWQHRG